MHLQINMKYLYLFVSFFVLNIHLKAQTNGIKLSVSIENQNLDGFAKKIEAISDYRFFYNPTISDSLSITIEVSNKSLNEILDVVLTNKKYKYAIDDQKHVFITENYAIETKFSELANAGIIDQNELQAQREKQNVKTQTVKASSSTRLYEIGIKSDKIGSGNAILTGYVNNSFTGVPLSNVNIIVENTPFKTATDQYGYYVLKLPKGRHILKFSAVGVSTEQRQVVLFSDGAMDVSIKDEAYSLKEVKISGEKINNINSVKMGVEKISIATIKQIPTAFGETDILRVVLTLPGVKSAGEASTGFNVRGGSTDQNLILFNDQTVYNPSHLFGFFSAFNADAVKDVELYKNSIPVKFGGRISSVLDIAAKEGNKNKLSGAGGIGLLTSRLSFEGPLGENTSFLVGGRTTYSNWLFDVLPKTDYSNSKASFYDVNLNLNHKFNNKNTLYLTGYLSNDKFKLNSDTLYGYHNRNINLKWKHIFSNKLNVTFSSGYDGYGYNIESEANPVNAYKLDFGINQYNLKGDFSYKLGLKHNLNFGFASIYYKLNPGAYLPIGESKVSEDVVRPEQALETAIYLGDRFEVSDKFSVDAGLRFVVYNYLGPNSISNYVPDMPITELTEIDQTVYSKGKIINTYSAPEIRIAARYSLSASSSIKASYNTLRQYIHMLSNTTAISPTDIWKLSDPYIKPQSGNQVSLGFYNNFRSNSVETSVEFYYKNIKNFLDYKSGAKLILNHNLERDVINTIGKAYGAEFMIKKLTGKLNGWIGYTYSRSLQRTEDALTPGELINRGEEYASNFDRPHDMTIVANYKFSHRFSISANFTYSTGRPITLPIAKYTYGGSERVLYSDRNQYRIPDFYRGDLALNIEGNHKIKKLAHSSWTVGVYNIAGRQNAYSVFYNSENGRIRGYQMSIFGQPIPFINYNFKF